MGKAENSQAEADNFSGGAGMRWLRSQALVRRTPPTSQKMARIVGKRSLRGRRDRESVDEAAVKVVSFWKSRMGAKAEKGDPPFFCLRSNQNQRIGDCNAMPDFTTIPAVGLSPRGSEPI
jgi:hypothetical protein